MAEISPEQTGPTAVPGWGQPPVPGQMPAPMPALAHPPVWYGPGTVGPVPRSTNGMAITSLVLGVLGIPLLSAWPLTVLPAALALVFGYVARAQIRRCGELGGGMAIAGIVLGWVTLALWLAVLAIFALFLVLTGP